MNSSTQGIWTKAVGITDLTLYRSDDYIKAINEGLSLFEINRSVRWHVFI